MEALDFKLQRYIWDYMYEKSRPDPDGKWVKWEDVEPLIKAYLELTNTKNKRLGFTKIEVIK